jgi:hypothetical protein
MLRKLLYIIHLTLATGETKTNKEKFGIHVKLILRSLYDCHYALIRMMFKEHNVYICKRKCLKINQNDQKNAK